MQELIKNIFPGPAEGGSSNTTRPSVIIEQLFPFLQVQRDQNHQNSNSTRNDVEKKDKDNLTQVQQQIESSDGENQNPNPPSNTSMSCFPPMTAITQQLSDDMQRVPQDVLTGCCFGP